MLYNLLRLLRIFYWIHLYSKFGAKTWKCAWMQKETVISHFTGIKMSLSPFISPMQSVQIIQVCALLVAGVERRGRTPIKAK